MSFEKFRLSVEIIENMGSVKRQINNLQQMFQQNYFLLCLSVRDRQTEFAREGKCAFVQLRGRESVRKVKERW
jgi:hypothetical protein